MEITKKDIEKLIELRKENSFLNHLGNVFSRDFRAKGEIGRSEIKVWKQNIWNSAFYPIFTFELNSENHLINITDKLNPIGKTLVGILSLVVFYFIFSILYSDFNFQSLSDWIIILTISLFIFISMTVFRKIYLFEKQNQLDKIFDFLEIETEDKEPKKESSLKNILIRLFTYPFCIFLIVINFILLIPDGKYFSALITFGIVGVYLISDIKMILKK